MGSQGLSYKTEGEFLTICILSAAAAVAMNTALVTIVLLKLVHRVAKTTILLYCGFAERMKRTIALPGYLIWIHVQLNVTA